MFRILSKFASMIPLLFGVSSCNWLAQNPENDKPLGPTRYIIESVLDLPPETQVKHERPKTTTTE